MRFTKMHGIGNDYVYVDCVRNPPPRDPAAVALTVTIQFVTPPAPGARLTAEARATRQGKRTGFYAMTVTDEAGAVVATCQAVALRTRPVTNQAE